MSEPKTTSADSERRLNCDDGHRPCYCAGRKECHDCGQPLSDDYSPETLPNQETIKLAEDTDVNPAH